MGIGVSVEEICGIKRGEGLTVGDKFFTMLQFRYISRKIKTISKLVCLNYETEKNRR